MIRKNALYLGLVFLLIPYPIWFIVLGDNSYVTIHDNLDSEFAFIRLLLNSDDPIGFDIDYVIESLMNGIPRYSFRTGLNITFLFFAFLPAIYAYIVNHLVVHVIGYLGMYFLLKRYFIKNSTLIILIVSLCFGYLSYYHLQYGISLAGQPALLYAFLNVLNRRQNWCDWLIIFAFPFFSFLIVTLPFFVPILSLIGIFSFWKTRIFNWRYFLCLFLICLINVIVEFPLLYSVLLANDYVSHRTVWNQFELYGNPSLSQFFTNIYISLKQTQYHAGKLYPLPIILAFIAGLLFKNKFGFTSKVVSIVIGAIIIWVALNKSLIFYLGESVNILRSFNSERFYFILPFLWLMLFGMILDQFNWQDKRQKVLAILLVILLVSGIVANNKELVMNTKLLVGATIDEPTFNQFYDRRLFREIKEIMGSDFTEGKKVISIGMFPNIAQYNGLKTLDGYQNNYDLEYKLEFRKIIRGELVKDKRLSSYFDKWGSRCYAFSAEIGKNYLIGKNAAISIESINLDIDQIRKMKGKYILSALPIDEFNDSSVSLIKSVSSVDSFWKIYIYQL
ncbi:DUF6044 family protein [Reichenbachiella sp.]|uniref:DUF6044 family protein n=1 Tax=Reichenbachiella sp. TaxID=2184521 RepID=UPI003BB20643